MSKDNENASLLISKTGMDETMKSLLNDFKVLITLLLQSELSTVIFCFYMFIIDDQGDVD